MKLFLLRHSQACDTYPDPTRDLSAYGIDQIKKLSGMLDKKNFSDVTQIWHSPYLRAVRTAEIFKEETQMQAALVPSGDITPYDSPHKVARTISSVSCFGGDLMVVSHNPFLENLTDVLLDGNERGGRAVFLKCTIASLILEEPPSTAFEYGKWSLDFLISPYVFS